MSFETQHLYLCPLHATVLVFPYQMDCQNPFKSGCCPHIATHTIPPFCEDLFSGRWTVMKAMRRAITPWCIWCGEPQSACLCPMKCLLPCPPPPPPFLQLRGLRPKKGCVTFPVTTALYRWVPNIDPELHLVRSQSSSIST